MILELTDELENPQRVEPQIRHQLALGGRINRAAAQPLENLDSVAFEALGGKRGACTRRGASARGVGNLGQAVKCNTNLTRRAIR